MYLVEGQAGAGKTTLGMQFLIEGIRTGQRCLYVTLSESKAELEGAAQSHGWSLDGATIAEFVPEEASLAEEERYTVFHPGEVELASTIKNLLAEIERVAPERLVIDSLSEFRLLAQDAVRYRRQLLALKQFFYGRNTTVLLLDDHTPAGDDQQVLSIVHGVIRFTKVQRSYGAVRRHVEIVKIRSSGFREGYHDYTLDRRGLVVFRRLVASVYSFDETLRTARMRAISLGMQVDPEIERQHLRIEQMDAGEISTGEFAWRIRQEVEERNTRVVVIDSLNGFLRSMSGEADLALHLHELLSFLNVKGVVTFMILTQQGLMGERPDPIDISYLADTLLVMRYFEVAASVRRAISVLKKRSGAHEATIRELRFSSEGVQIGEPLAGFKGILSGLPDSIQVQEPDAEVP
jgi:circadian clock protein KaiC